MFWHVGFSTAAVAAAATANVCSLIDCTVCVELPTLLRCRSSLIHSICCMITWGLGIDCNNMLRFCCLLVYKLRWQATSATTSPASNHQLLKVQPSVHWLVAAAVTCTYLLLRLLLRAMLTTCTSGTQDMASVVRRLPPRACAQH